MEFKVEEVKEEKGIHRRIDAQIALIREAITFIDDKVDAQVAWFEKMDYKDTAELSGDFVGFLVDSHLKDRCVEIMGKRYYDLDADKIVISRSNIENIITKLHYIGNYLEDPDPETREKVIKDIHKSVDELEAVVCPNEKEEV